MRKTMRVVSALVAVFAILNPIFFVSAQIATSSIQAQIDDQNAQISELNSEIAQYQTQLNATVAQKQSLQNALNQISLTLKKTNASITLSQTQITATQLELDQLSSEISQKQGSIQSDQAALAQSLRSLSAAESVPLVVQVLSVHTLSEIWDDVDETASVRDAFDNQVNTLETDQRALASSQSNEKAKQNQLVQAKQSLQTQQGSLTATQAAKNQLLAQTKSQEATYESIIAQKQSQEKSFEEQLNNLKAQYNQAVNPTEITQAAPGVLQWPIAGQIRITQFFGNTPFADAHAPLYSGHGHDGLDIAAPIGTPVMAALAGTVIGTGNTDAVKSCVGGSFGKWVMIQHDNGLNTMYAHLSQINVSQGDQIATGQVIGYSGETGYATGPHLHFGVYVSAVTKIIPLGQATGGNGACSKAVMPVPPVSGYLNPLNYLPATTFINSTGT
ncbi:MAG TPA: peptidoglycan DD-metalloendopeptidase family protein [Candidatus Paceibacterota bacterium]|nr:peptidoglycan DD-metalloendopeptidase family protein [Candidatus Paceibacterota bacterium]